MKLFYAMVQSLVAAASMRCARGFAPHPPSLSKSSSSSSLLLPSSFPLPTRLFVFDKLFGTTGSTTNGLPIYAEESVMSQKAHGTSEKPVQQELRWNCDYKTADRICNFNRHYAEYAGYWQTTDFLKYVKENYKEGAEPIQFYDSVTGKLLFRAPVGRSLEDFLKESASHGWPSFRDEEVVWDDVRCLRNGECVSTTGTHLGHNLPDSKGNRYCINLVSVAGNPKGEDDESG